MEEKPHVPGQTDTEFPDPLEKEPEAPPAETPKAEEPKEETPKEDPKPEPEKEKAEGDKPADQPQAKKRSIYDDYKEKKQEAKDATDRAEAAEAKVAELTALLDAQKDADTPKEKKDAADDIAAFAEREGMRPDALRELTDLILKKVPKSDAPTLSPDEIKAFRDSQAAQQRHAEDQAILAKSSDVKAQLAIHDDGELQTVMKEVVRLAHTTEFHDKEVEYIVWKNRDALAKMVSPKKPSFEPGGQRGQGSEREPDFSHGGVTPAMAQQGMEARSRGGSGYEVKQNR